MDQSYFTNMVAHIVRLAKMPAWKAWAKQWAQELEADKSGAYKGLLAAVRSRLESSSAAPKNGASNS